MGSFAGQIIYSALAFVGSVASARLLGASGRGELAPWTLSAGIGSLILTGTVPAGLGRAYLAGERRQIVRTALVHGVFALGCSALAFVVGLALGLDPVRLGLIVLVAIPAGAVTYDFLVVFQAGKTPWRYQGVRIIDAGTFTVVLTIIYLAKRHLSVDAACLYFSVASAASMVAAIAVARARYGWTKQSALLDSMERGRGSYVATVLDSFLLRLDQFFVFALAGPAALGVYVVAVNWSEIAAYLGHAIGGAAFEEKETLDTQAALRLFRLSALSVSALCAAVALSGVLLINPIFGREFSDARVALLLLAPGIVARTVGYTGGQILIAQGEGRRLSRLTLKTFVAALPLWAAGAYWFGVYGAAVASTVVYGLQMQLVLRRFADRTKRPRSTVAPTGHT
jgi:O-antigen/teichoic acid export membrane protein